MGTQPVPSEMKVARPKGQQLISPDHHLPNERTPDGMREMHWHTLADEWQYDVSGKGHMTLLDVDKKARTSKFQAGYRG